MTRRAFTAQALAPVAVLGGRAVKPNIVFIILDDLGLYHLGCYGSNAIHTPNIDRLAAEGMRFDDAYSGCTVCAPARSTLMTGTHMGHTPVRGNSGGVSLRAEDITLAEVLQKGGYVCGGFGKWGLGDLDTPGTPERHGFARFFGYYHQVHAHHFYPDYLIDTGQKAPMPGNRGFYAKKATPGAYPQVDAGTGIKRQFSSYLIFEEMKGFLRANKNRPFFCYAPWTVPHANHEIPDSDPAWKLYKDKPWSMKGKVHAAYCNMADRFVGETMALLKELGLDSNTIVMFCSDNGAAASYDADFGVVGEVTGQKGSMNEGGLRVPFIARWPGRIKPRSSSDAPVYFPDVLPTLAEVAAATPHLPRATDGISLAPELLGVRKIDRERFMYWEWNGEHFAKSYHVKNQACRRGRWKILRDDVSAPWRLYDLVKDRGERTDLAGRHPEIVKELAAWISANRVDPPPQVEPAKPAGQRWR